MEIVLRNSFGFGGGLPQQFSGPFPQQGFGQLGSGGGFFNSGPQFPGGNAFSGGSPFPGGMPFSGGSPFQGVNAFPGGNPFSSPLPPSGFPSGPIGSPFGQGFGFPAGSGGFGYQPQPFGSPFFPGQQPPFANQNYFGSGSYGQPRSRHSSRRSSKSRRRRTSSSSTSSDENSGRGSPFFNPGNPYVNLQPFPNMPPVPPRVASPLIPPQRPIW
jgi:hypothetical protein